MAVSNIESIPSVSPARLGFNDPATWPRINAAIM
tara:strand:- start:89 stop:190 length:102 start_codon:yes stop_codon:yes gene_type:complete